METALSYLNVLPSKAEEVRSFAKQILDKVESGELNPLDVQTQIEWISKTLKAITDPIWDKVMTESDKHGKDYEHKGLRIQNYEAGTRYDFTADAKWVEMNKALKEREALLKGLKKEMADTETGEILYPPIKKSTTTLKFSMI